MNLNKQSIVKDSFIKIEKFIEKRFFLIISIIVMLKLLLLAYYIHSNWLTWDKGIWYDAIINMHENEIIPYLNSENWTLGISEYPIAFTYFLLCFYPMIDILSKKAFFSIFGIVQILFDLGITILLIKILKNKTRILFGFILTPTVLVLSTSRFDLMPSFFVLLAIYLLSIRKDAYAAIVHAVAILLKIYPIALFFGLLNKLITRYRYWTVLIITGLALNWFIFVHPHTIIYPITKMGGYRVESLVGMLGLFGVFIKHADLINRVILIILALLGFIKAKTSYGKAICIIIALLVSSKVLSPQWNLWLLPLLVLTRIPISYILIFDFITIIEFPYVWSWASLISGFDHTRFDPLNPVNIVFIVLNLLRYAFFAYFYVRCLNDKHLINPNVSKNIQKLIK